MRFRLYPTPPEAEIMRRYCADARLMWNLALEQSHHWQPGFRHSPGYVEMGQQLTELRAAEPWLAANPYVVQKQALRDFDQAMRNFFRGTHRRPTWRKKGRDEGFRIVYGQREYMRRLGGRWGQVWIPKLGWVKFRWSRIPERAKSYRVTLDSTGRWHVAFATVPPPVLGPGDGSVIGIDRGVAATIATSDGEMFHAPVMAPREQARMRHLQRQLARQKKGSNRRARTKAALARLRCQERDRRKDWAEKASTDLARRYDLIRLENLDVRAMTRSARGTIEKPGRNVRAKAGLNRAILEQGWSLFATRLQHKAVGRVELVPAARTSQRCSACGHTDPASRESQAVFRCQSCGHEANADVNAAKNIAAGYAVTAREGLGAVGLPMNRESVADPKAPVGSPCQ